MPNLTIELPSQEEQAAFNLERWAELLENESLAAIPGRVETDRHGHILMSPPASPDHGRFQFKLPHLLIALLPDGECFGECPISTPDGVRVVDAAWISRKRLAKNDRKICLTLAPEICVEIISPGNTPREMEEKKALYFAAGAKEVWFCAADGKMTFFVGAQSKGKGASRLCPQFRAQVEL